MPFIQISIDPEILVEVDEEDHLYLLLICSWNVSNSGYIQGRVNGKMKNLHIVIAERMGLSLLNEIDHEDRNKFNCKRSNLRVATRGQNTINSKVHSDNISGYKGVRKMGNKWQARIGVNHKKIHLGSFDTPEEAHAAYCKAAEEHFGEFFNSGE